MNNGTEDDRAILDLEERVARFEAEWVAGRTPDPATFAPSATSPHRAHVLCELLAIDREFRLAAQLPLPAYEALYPTICQDPAYTAAIHKDETGRLLGRYELGALLGRGSFGKVYRGWDPQLRRPVAIKVPRMGAVLTTTETERFQREARCAAGLQHPHIVTLYDLGYATETLFLVYELVEGESLAQVLQRERLPLRTAAELVALLASAVQAAHTQGVIHRDLKPANVLLAKGDYRTAKITDFGLARRLDEAATQSHAGQLLGTPAYMAPEQVLGRPADQRTDVYALGVMLYELLTGEVPFRGEAIMVLRQVREDEPTPPKRLQSAIPLDLNTICLKCLHKDPVQRYPSMAELANDLQRWLAGQPILARPVGPLGRWRRWAKREPQLAGMTIGLVVVLSIGLTAVTWLFLHAREQSREADRRRWEADDHFHDAMRVIDESFTTLAESPDLDRPGMQPLRRELIAAALARYQALLAKRADDPTIQQAIGRGWYRAAYLQYIVGPEREALPALQNAQRVQEALCRLAPDHPDHPADLAATLAFAGYLTSRLGDAPKALAYYEQARLLQEPRHQVTPDRKITLELAETWRGIGRIHVDYGDPVAGERWLQQADALLTPWHMAADAARMLTIIRFDQMQSLRGRGLLHEALRVLLSAQDALQQATDTPPPQQTHVLQIYLSRFEHARWQSIVENGLGLLHMGLDQVEQALQHFTKAHDLRQRLMNENPNVPAYKAEYASSLLNRSIARERAGQTDLAHTERHTATQLYRQLLLDNPELYHLRDSASYAHHRYAELLTTTGNTQGAIRTYDDWIATCRTLHAPGVAERLSMVEAMVQVHRLSDGMKPLPKAITSEFDTLRTTLDEQYHQRRRDCLADPNNSPARRAFSDTLERRATLERLAQQPLQVAVLAEERLALWPHNPREQVRAAITWFIALVQAHRDPAPATQALRHALAEGYADRGWLRHEQQHFPELRHPTFQQFLRAAFPKP